MQLDLPLTGQAVDFSTALTWLKAGERVRRPVWPEEMFLEVADIEYIRRSKRETSLVIDVVRECGEYSAWTPAQSDILANDWVLAP